MLFTGSCSLPVHAQLINSSGTAIFSRINAPEGYVRQNLDSNSFAYYLRNLPLKPDGALVKYYNGSVKARMVHAAVIDMSVGKKDLQQCADAVMRLRAEYLYQQNRLNGIHFNFTNGFRAEYTKWIKGYGIKVKGNEVSWIKTTNPANSHEDLLAFMEVVFTYAGTLSLEKEMKQIRMHEAKAGDILIQGGSPGHAVIIVDEAVDPQTGKKLYLLAQSYMPAQDIHVLKNPTQPAISPWYDFETFNEIIITPEWKFKPDDFRTFK